MRQPSSPYRLVAAVHIVSRKGRPATAWLIALLLVIASLGPWRTGARRAHAEEKLAPLEKTLRSEPSAAARQKAAEAIGKLGDADALPVLIQVMLADRNERVRAACAEALGELGEPAARAALRAASKDDSALVRKQAEAALARVNAPKPPKETAPLQKVTVVVGRMGSKAKSGTLSDLPKRLRDAVLKELRDTPEVVLVDEPKAAKTTKKGFSVDSSVTKLARRTTAAGELEISCEVSMIIAMLPAHNIVSMTSGGATVQAPRGPSTKPTKALIQNLETDALTQAVHGAHESLISFLRHQNRPEP